ncbi:polyphosphate kinase 2 [Sphingomonas sp. MMS24-JH45]
MADHAAEDRELQLGLVRMQQAMAQNGQRAVVALEGATRRARTARSSASSSICRSATPASWPKPSDREASQWYFQRYVAHLPAAGEIVIFNRSWYNRAGVEVVNGFSTPTEQARFLADVPGFEAMLVESGIALVKLWLDIGKAEQAERLAARHDDPLKALKSLLLDAVAQEKWDEYTAARDTMLLRTHVALSPRWCVAADHKKRARRMVIRHLLRTLAPAEVAKGVKAPDPDTLFAFEANALEDGRLAPAGTVAPAQAGADVRLVAEHLTRKRSSRISRPRSFAAMGPAGEGDEDGVGRRFAAARVSPPSPAPDPGRQARPSRSPSPASRRGSSWP